MTALATVLLIGGSFVALSAALTLAIAALILTAISILLLSTSVSVMIHGYDMAPADAMHDTAPLLPLFERFLPSSVWQALADGMRPCACRCAHHHAPSAADPASGDEEENGIDSATPPHDHFRSHEQAAHSHDHARWYGFEEPVRPMHRQQPRHDVERVEEEDIVRVGERGCGKSAQHVDQGKPATRVERVGGQEPLAAAIAAESANSGEYKYSGDDLSTNVEYAWSWDAHSLPKFHSNARGRGVGAGHGQHRRDGDGGGREGYHGSGGRWEQAPPYGRRGPQGEAPNEWNRGRRSHDEEDSGGSASRRSFGEGHKFGTRAQQQQQQQQQDHLHGQQEQTHPHHHHHHRHHQRQEQQGDVRGGECDGQGGSLWTHVKCAVKKQADDLLSQFQDRFVVVVFEGERRNIMFRMEVSVLGVLNDLGSLHSMPSTNTRRLRDIFLHNFGIAGDYDLQLHYFDEDYDRIPITNDFELFEAFRSNPDVVIFGA